MPALRKSSFRRSVLRHPQDSAGGVPYTIAGLLAHWRADDLRATLADAAAVSSWTDASGNGNTIGNTLTNRPAFDYTNPIFNGHASVNFTAASTQYLFGSAVPICTALTGADMPFEVIVVCRRPAKLTTGSECIWSLGNSGSGTVSYAAGVHNFGSNQSRMLFRIRDDAGTAETSDSGLNEVLDLGLHIDIHSLTGTSATKYLIGSTLNPLYDATVANDAAVDYSAQGTITFNRFAIAALVRNAATLPAGLQVAEVLVYNRALGASERQRLCEHLWNKYAPRVITSANDIPGLTNWHDASQLAGAAAADVNTWADLIGDIDFDATGFDAPVVALHENGSKVVHFQGTDDAMDSAAASDGNFLHNDAESTFAIVYRVEAATEATNPILDTNGNSTTARGFSLVHDGASAAHSLQIKIANGTTNVINHDSQDYGDRPGQWSAAIVVHQPTIPSTEEDYHIWLNGEHYAAIDASNAESASDAAGAITLGKLAGAATFGTVKIAEIVHYNRALGTNELDALNQYFARKWQTAHCALVGGNGLAGILDDAASHRGFPSACVDSRGVRHVIYRQAATHGSSRGVGIHCTSADGIRWSPERIIYDVNDSNGRDFRAEGGFICLTQGTHAGRLLYFTKWSADNSDLYITGVPSTLLIGYSDDHGGSWTWLDPVENDTDLDNWVYTASPNGLIELATGTAGRILATFTMNDTDTPPEVSNQDLRLIYSDDGGLTWSQSVVVAEHDAAAPNGIGNGNRVTESHIIEFADGELLMSLRNDSDQEVWFAHGNTSDVESWTIDGTAGFSGFGRPVMAIDPNDSDAVFWWGRSTPGLLTVWRYSDDRGVTWGDEHAFSNLHSTTTITAFAAMSYVHPCYNADGDIELTYGLEESTSDSDVFYRLWSLVA